MCSFLYTLLSSIPGTLFGSWFGARFAFKNDKKIIIQEKLGKEVECCKYAQFIIITHIHFIENLKKFSLGPKNKVEDSSILLKRWEYVESLPCFNFEKLSFLLDNRDPMILYKLFLHERKFLELRDCLTKRDDFLASVSTTDNLKKQLIPYNADVMKAFERTNLSTQEIFTEFLAYLRTRYSGTDFLTIEQTQAVEHPKN